MSHSLRRGEGESTEPRALASGVLLELLGGARDEKSYGELLEELSALQQFSINEAVWTRSYRSAFDLKRHGVTVPATDVLIATVAQENRVTLLHRES